VRPIDSFDRDVLLLAMAIENMEKYDVIDFSGSINGYYELHVNSEKFKQLAQGREVTETERDSEEYPIELSFFLHGIKVFALYPAEEEGETV